MAAIIAVSILIGLIAGLIIAELRNTAQPADGQEAQDTSDVPPGLLETGIPPEPDQATADAYIAALDAIDPGITRGDRASAIDRGRDVCSTIRSHPDDRAHQVETTNQRFTSPDHPDGWGPEVAEQLLDVVHQHLCPSY